MQAVQLLPGRVLQGESLAAETWIRHQRIKTNVAPRQCNWETENNAPEISTSTLKATKSSASSLKSSQSASPDATASTPSLSVPQQPPSPRPEHRVRVSYLTEQTSHHPPVSAFHISCPERGLTARGFDQITAKFTGTTIKVSPGEHNMGIFITLDNRDGEEYQLTHPAAHLGGFFRGNLNISVSEGAYITCPRTKLKAILSYVDEGWIGRTTNKVEGVIFKYDPENDNKTRIKDVPDEDVLARLSGPWKEKVVMTLGPKPVVRTPSPPPNRPLELQTDQANLAIGLPPQGSPVHDNRHRAPGGRAKGPPAPREAAPQRVPHALVRRHGRDPRQAVLQGDVGKGGSRGGAAGEGEAAGARWDGVAARLLRGWHRE